jgi:hypothetical protein
MAAAQPNYVPFLFLAFIGWRMYVRIRRTIGRQPVRPKRMITGIVIYSILFLLLSLAGIQYPKILLGMGGGLLLGVPLAFVGLHFTRFENTPQGRFYTSHPYIGISIAALLVIRMFYRMTIIMGASPEARTSQAMMQSPLTFSLFGLLAGYYIAFYAGVLYRSGRSGIVAGRI